MTPNASLLISDAHGIYIPYYFATQFNWDIPPELQEDFDILKSGTDDEFYWEAWDDIINSFTLIDDDGRKCMLYVNGDVWAIPEDEYELIPEDY